MPLGILLACAALLAQAPEALQTIVCPGSYDGHLQGIAVDDKGAVYWSFTVSLAKTDAHGVLLHTAAVPSHHGDLCVEDGVLYAAVNYPAEDAQPATRNSFIYAYDAGDLTLRWKKPIYKPREGAGALAIRDGHLFVASGRRIKPFEHNTIFEYDLNFALVATHTLESGRTYLGIQTMAYAHETWWFGCYGNPPETLRAGNNFAFESRFEFDCAMGIARLPGGGYLVGRGEKNPDGKYTGAALRVEHPEH